jgi:magnesium transporter
MRKSKKHKIGMAPGSLIYTGEMTSQTPVLSLINYGADHLHEDNLSLAELANLEPSADKKLWLNLSGLQDTNYISELGKQFNLHPLVMEDILNTDQRPKVESYGEYLYIVLRNFQFKRPSHLLSTQISLVLGKHFVLTFQEQGAECFDPVRERLRNGRVHIRQAETDYLAYALIDVIVDQYFSIIEDIGLHCETLEEKLLRKPSASLLQKIQALKRESMELRRGVWPTREVINNLIRNDEGFFQAGTILYLRDIYDHAVHVIESLEAVRDLLAGMLDIYLSTISNQLNKEVRALTVVTMMFMPATLISGIFGMNFESIPLLKDKFGFWIALSIMGLIAIGMGLHFVRKQWISHHGI